MQTSVEQNLCIPQDGNGCTMKGDQDDRVSTPSPQQHEKKTMERTKRACMIPCPNIRPQQRHGPDLRKAV